MKRSLTIAALLVASASLMPQCVAEDKALPPEAAKAGLVYVGVADQWNDLLAHPDQWQYVRQNADGFYVNFIEMGWILKGEQGKSQATVNGTAALFTHKNAYFESDMNNGLALDQRAIVSLQQAGFAIPYTSLNYGWDAVRARNLEEFGVTGHRRFGFVQNGPWTIGGDIRSDKDTHPVFTNAQYRAWVAQCDGLSTDGPLGLWFADAGGMRSGSLSMVQFAHSLHKTAVVMLCPYGANQKGYDPSMFLSEGQDCVRAHEDVGAIPDVWAVFEYATSIAAVPEQAGGKPVSTSTGMAYWLIHHLQDPDRAARLSVSPSQGKTAHTAQGTTQTFACTLQNDSPWLDLCPVVRARLTARDGHWTAKYTLDGLDVTAALTQGDGLVCVGPRRLLPGARRVLQITLNGPPRSKPAQVVLELMPHPTRMELHQRLILHSTGETSNTDFPPEGH